MTRLSREAVTAARDTSSRSICSSRRRASRARWSISTRDTLLLHKIAFNMTPSVAHTPPTGSREAVLPKYAALLPDAV
jgi:hypothetical protein